MITERRIEFEWDEANIQHLRRHKVSPAEFEEAIRNDPVYTDIGDEKGEERYHAVGVTNGLRVLILVLVYRAGKVRPITAWDADKTAREFYFRTVGEQDG
jgi:uncharacterized DUF497 family protein